MRWIAAPLLISLIAFASLMVAYYSVYMTAAYSVHMPIMSVDPIAGKPAMTYRLGKNNYVGDRNEVRSVSLTTSGTTVTGATVQIFVRNAGWYDVTVRLYDANGNTISIGSPPMGCVYLSSGLQSASVSMSPQVSIDSVYTVEASAFRLIRSCIIDW
jgi:type 1 fimbria pilin